LNGQEKSPRSLWGARAKAVALRG